MLEITLKSLKTSDIKFVNKCEKYAFVEVRKRLKDNKNVRCILNSS